MIILPAIDIKRGKCVRLTQGKEGEEKIYYEDPVEVALDFEEKGAQYLHVINLDGAFENASDNLEIIRTMRAKIRIPMEVGGGIRDLSAVEKYLDMGIDRVILGTVAVQNPELVRDLCNAFGDKIAVSIDALQGTVATHGWREASSYSVFDFCDTLMESGVKTIIYTDIQRDGMLSGPDYDTLKALQSSYSCQFIASGGVSSAEDLRKLRKLDLYGAIVGKAIYENKIDIHNLKTLQEELC